MPRPFDGLLDQLLRGGVGPAHARRYVAELRDHLEDLVAEEQQAGGDAAARALARLGRADDLAGAMIARRELRAWSARAPLAAWLVAPSLALVAGAALAMAGLVVVSHLIASADAPVMFTNSVLPVLLGWALVARALRQRSAPGWPLAGLVLVAALGAALQVEATLPAASTPGEINLASSFGSITACAAFAGRLAVTLALTLTPYAALRQRRVAEPAT